MNALHTHVLSPLDQLGPKVYTRMAIVFPTTDHDRAISVLQVALSKTCHQIPFLKGRVFEKGAYDRTVSHISWNPEDPSIQLQEISAPAEIPSYEELNVDRTPFPPGIYPTPVPSSEGAPVMTASFTKIRGGLVVCLVTCHKVVDGTGYSEILRIWGEHANESHNAVSLSRPDPDEILRRRSRILGPQPTMPEHIQKLGHKELLERHPEYALKSILGPPRAPTAKSGNGTNAVFAFSGAKLNSIRVLLSEKLPPKALSINNLLMAIIWSSITKVRTKRPENPISALTSKMDYSVSGRRILGLHDPPFLGNALGYGLTELPIEDIAFIPSESTLEKLVPIIAKIAKASELTADHILEMSHISDTLPDVTDIIPSWLFYGPGDLHFTSWAQVDIYNLDFGPGVGRPGFMRSAFMKFDGVVNLLPRRRTLDKEGEEAIEVSVLLREDDMRRLADDDGWKGWLVKDAKDDV